MELAVLRLVLLRARALLQRCLPARAKARVLRRRGQVVDELEREEVAPFVDEHLEPVERPPGEALDERLADHGIELASLEGERAQVVDCVLELSLPRRVARREAGQHLEQRSFPNDTAQPVVVEAQEVLAGDCGCAGVSPHDAHVGAGAAAEVHVVGHDRRHLELDPRARRRLRRVGDDEPAQPCHLDDRGSCGARGSLRRSARGRPAASRRTSHACSCPCEAGRSIRSAASRSTGRETSPSAPPCRRPRRAPRRTAALRPQRWLPPGSARWRRRSRGRLQRGTRWSSAARARPHPSPRRGSSGARRRRALRTPLPGQPTSAPRRFRLGATVRLGELRLGRVAAVCFGHRRPSGGCHLGRRRRPEHVLEQLPRRARARELSARRRPASAAARRSWPSSRLPR